MKNQNRKCNQNDYGFDCSTSSFHNSINTGPIYKFFTKKCNYFSQENLIFVSVPIKVVFWHFEFLFLPKITTFHRQQDGIPHFCLSPIKSGVLALWIHIFTKKIMDFSKLNCSTSFKLPNHPFYWDWDKNEWFHIVACEK